MAGNGRDNGDTKESVRDLSLKNGRGVKYLCPEPRTETLETVFLSVGEYIKDKRRPRPRAPTPTRVLLLHDRETRDPFL